MGLADRLLALPFFLFSIFFFYWSIPIGSLAGRIKFAQLNASCLRKDMYDW